MRLKHAAQEVHKLYRFKYEILFKSFVAILSQTIYEIRVIDTIKLIVVSIQ